ncbi:MAG: extracellular solute-binding protein [Candidatus Aenigmatarchaeota archaeon]
MTDRQPAFEELAKKYYQNTGIKVEFQLFFPPEAYVQKIKASAQGKNLPDIFGILGEKRDLAAFIKAGLVLDLTEYMREEFWKWRNSFFSKAIEINTFEKDNAYNVKEGIYGVPIDVMTIQLVYNKALFRELGLNPEKPPQTFEEFLKIGEMAKSKNLIGLVSGWAEVWLIDCFFTTYAINIMGEDKIIKTIEGVVPYTDPDWIEVFDIFRKMRDASILQKEIVSMINKTAEQVFANNKAVFGFNGSWCVNVYKGMNPNLEYAPFLPPKISDNYPIVIRGGAGSSFMVNALSKNREEAVKFLRWLTDIEQQVFLAKTTNNLPANKYSITDLPKTLVDFTKGLENATHPNVWKIRESPQVIEAIGRGIQLIILGKRTPQEVAEDVQGIKEKFILKDK